MHSIVFVVELFATSIVDIVFAWQRELGKHAKCVKDPATAEFVGAVTG